jgi:hypothetical protein
MCSPDDERNALLGAFVDDELSPEQQQRLAELVQSDASARARYLDHCGVHAALAWEHGVLGQPSPIANFAKHPRLHLVQTLVTSSKAAACCGSKTPTSESPRVMSSE